MCLYTRTCLNLKFETGSYSLKSILKNSVHLGKNKISQHLGSSLETLCFIPPGPTTL